MTLKRFTTALGITLFLAACATTTTYDQQSLNKAMMLTPEEVAAHYQVDTEWWRGYQDEALNQLISRALANNSDLKKAAILLVKSGYGVQETRMSLFPEVRGDASATDGVSKNLKSGGETTRTASSSLSIGVSYELDLWQKIRAGKNIAAWEYAATEQDLAAARLSLINRVIDAYFHWAYLEEAIVLNQKVLVQQERLAKIAQSQYRHGKTAAIDAVNARQSLLSAQDGLQNLVLNRDNMQQNLRNLLNLRPGEELGVRPKSLQTIVPLTVDLDVPLSVLANRPDIQISRFRLQQSFATQEIARRNWLPSISLRAAINATSSQTGSYFNIPVGIANVTVNLPFLDWKNLYFQNKKARADFEVAKLDFEKTLTTVLNEVDGLYRQYRVSLANLSTAEQKYDADQKNTRYHAARYRYGAEALSDLLGAQNGELASAQSLLNARYTLLQNENLVYQAMAGRHRVR